ncbi:MAG: thioredoxin family protein [Gammaproteobacteria bacterium]
MALTETPEPTIGTAAPDFELPDPSGRRWTLADCRGERGTLVMFICNHCPYVRSAIDRIVADCRVLTEAGVGCVAIMPNDFESHPADRPEEMARFATEHGLFFPYLVDESQAVARAYGAVCTPDFFGYDKGLRLAYRGRLDAGNPRSAPAGGDRELLDAMRAVAGGGTPPAGQHPSMGCSIKWRAD